MKVIRIYTGSDGESHFEDLEPEMTSDGYGGVISAPVKAKSVMFRETGGDYHVGFHNAPRRQYVVNLSGSVEIETGAGEKRLLGPRDVLLVSTLTRPTAMVRLLFTWPVCSISVRPCRS